MKELLLQYKDSLLFIAKFVGLYLVLNTAYGFFVEHYEPRPDPITEIVTRHVAFGLSLFHDQIDQVPDPLEPNIHIQLDRKNVVSVFEGCNSVNVMIVYLAFIIAFKGSRKSTIIFVVLGFVVVYLINLLRVALLFEVAWFYPQHLYFFHKYLFTGIIYLIVFAIWYFWILRVKSESHHDR
jgi:exosortase family protein XrtF